MSELRRRKEHDEIDSDDSYTEELKDIIADIESDREKEKIMEPDTRWIKIKKALREWGAECSWHGVPHMATSVSLFTILLWSLILFVSAVLFVYLVTSTVIQYLKFSKTVNLKMEMSPSSFPSTTFCNSNPYKLSAVQAIPELEALLEIYSSSAT